MKIDFVLDEADSDDPMAIDPVGDITIESRGESITERFVYIDSWLNALLEGSRKARFSERLDVDLLEERDPLVFERRNESFLLSFRGKSIVVDNLDQLEAASIAGIENLSQIMPIPNNVTPQPDESG
ncbi:MAG: hypothetical protein IPM50_14140 [Acidobacteriota bacterium]|nr:MAG: hypothetical protein IPM50_14140 [Acidobacteriota bacterium]